MVLGLQGPDDSTRDLKCGMDCWPKTVSINVPNTSQLCLVISRHREFDGWVSDVGNGSLKEARDTDLDIG
jgi:hypothetical protein